MNATTDKTLPAIGTAFEGGIYSGITLHDNQLHALVLLPGDEGDKNHADAAAWAADQGGVLPSRHDGLVLVKNLKSEFQRDWYWLDEEVASYADYAWFQFFGYGYQFIVLKSYSNRCRAVRRVAI